MKSFIARLPIVTLVTALIVCACEATTPTGTSAPNTSPAASPAPVASRAVLASAAVTPSSATAASTAAPIVSRSPSAVASPLDGKYQTSFTKAELVASPLITDAGELNDGNWGDWTLSFSNGQVAYTQSNPLARGSSSGTFTLDGDAVRMVFVKGANAGETFGFRWTLAGDTLSFSRDETLGPGPTPFLVRPWTRARANGGWTLAASMATAGGSPLTVLTDGSVLVAGGQDEAGAPLASAERYDPATGAWSPTGDMNTARGLPAAVRLGDGRVLVAGGFATAQGEGERALASAELYDPQSATWTVTGRMASARVYETATLLPDGDVLVAGGTSPSEFLGSAELYDPTTGTWTSAGSIPSGLAGAATLLDDGRVLVTGGGTALAQLYDPRTRTWTSTGSMHVSRDAVQSTLLGDGRVLVEGGGHVFGTSAEIYDAASGTWTATGELHQRRDGHTASLLTDGRVVVAGGQIADGEPGLTATEIYDPSSGSWETAANMNVARYFASAAVLADGRLLVAGGENGAQRVVSAEIYEP